MIHTIVYIGDNYCRESGTVMSPIYEVIEGKLNRSDWGFCRMILHHGDEILIRQASHSEKQWAQEELKRIKEED